MSATCSCGEPAVDTLSNRRMITTIKEASRLTGVPAGTIRRWITEGRICRLGDHKPWRVRISEVEQLRAIR